MFYLNLHKKINNYSIFFTIPVVIYLSLTFYNHINSDLYMSYLDRVDFFIHELWHIVFSIFWNKLLWVAWWTILQLVIPFVCMFWFYRQSDYFAVCLCYAWLWSNFFYISTYSQDAIKMSLPLIWIWWWEVIHDWNYIFSNLWLLNFTDLISQWFKIIAIFLFLLFFIYSFFLIINRTKEKHSFFW